MFEGEAVPGGGVEAADPDAPPDFGPGQDREVALGRLVLDPGMSARAEVDDGLVENYAEAMRQGDAFPPVAAFFDADGRAWLADGFHRVAAARRLGRPSIAATLRPGGRREALLFGLAANAAHDRSGRRRTSADLRKAVLTLLADPEWAGWSNRRIARHLGVGHTLVNQVRQQLEGAGGRPEAALRPPPRRAPGLAAGSREPRPEASIDPSGPTPEEVGAASPPAAPVVVRDDEKSDEQYLAELPLLPKLRGQARENYQMAALLYRRARALPTMAQTLKDLSALVKKGQSGWDTPEAVAIRSFVERPGPMQWKLCLGCDGTTLKDGKPCGHCRGNGYHRTR